MKLIQMLITVITTVALAVTFVGAGFLVCTVPPVTGFLSNSFSDDATSPFSRSQLVQVADATRDYSFGAHDRVALYNALYQVDLQMRQDILNANGTLPIGFPNLDNVKDRGDGAQFQAVFDDASEMYCYSSDTMAHLDDCYNVAHAAYIVLAIVAIVLVAGLITCGVLGRKRVVGKVLLVAGIVPLVSGAALGVFAAVDFQRFFATFHGLFFAQGNWQFPYDSLLICALPTEFWIGMGVVWLVVSVLASILSIAIGRRLQKR